MNTERGSIGGHEAEVGLESGLVHVGQRGEEPVHVLLRRRQAVGHLLGLVHQSHLEAGSDFFFGFDTGQGLSVCSDMS